MTEIDILTMLAAKFPVLITVFAILGALVVIGQMVVAFTPTKADDEAWEKIKKMPVVGGIISALTSFAPIQKK